MLDILAGRKTSAGLSGVVRMNGNPIRPEITSKYVSYVAQARPPQQPRHLPGASPCLSLPCFMRQPLLLYSARLAEPACFIPCAQQLYCLCMATGPKSIEQ